MPPHTQTVSSTHSVVFPSTGHQVLSSLVHLLGCSILAGCFARRFGLQNMSLAKFCIMAIFADSWLFVFSAGLLVNGVGMSLSVSSCLAGIYLCIFFYASSKVLIYLFLAEKVHIVWSAGKVVERFKSKVWVVCFVVLFGYLAILVLMLVGKIGYIRGDQSCIIGLQPMATIPLLTYDCFLNLFLTALFVWPILRRQLSNHKLRQLAKRTCWAAGVALTTSVINILILTLLHGHQLGWVCLASCGVDVTVNAVVIFAVSHRRGSASTMEADPPISSEKGLSERFFTPRIPVSIFGGKSKTGKPVVHVSGGNVPSYYGDFAATHVAESSSSMAIKALPQETSRPEVLDYLPASETVARLVPDRGVSNSDGDTSGPSLLDPPGRRLHSSASRETELEFSNYQQANNGSTINEEGRRGSRGILADLRDRFGKAKAVEDMSIEVTVTTECFEFTPSNETPLDMEDQSNQDDELATPKAI